MVPTRHPSPLVAVPAPSKWSRGSGRRLPNAVSAAEGLTECYSCSGSGSSVSCSLAVGIYTCEGYRLPTEAEWEGAARCGEDLLFAGSNTAGDVGWYTSNSGWNIHPVAGKAANACGLYDMVERLGVNRDLYSRTCPTARKDDPRCQRRPDRTVAGAATAQVGPTTGCEHLYRPIRPAG